MSVLHMSDHFANNYCSDYSISKHWFILSDLMLCEYILILILGTTVYAVIFKGHKFCGFHDDSLCNVHPLIFLNHDP